MDACNGSSSPACNGKTVPKRESLGKRGGADFSSWLVQKKSA